MTGYILLDTPNHAQPQGTYPRRGGARLSGTCIVHTSEGNWRGGVDGLTRLVQTRADWGCYHQACDWEDIARYYPWEWETWQDTETNNWAAGIAAACKTSDWGNMPADVEDGYYRNMARMAADFVTYMRDAHDVAVPLRKISGAEARNRVPGFCAHGDSGIARSDPGAHFNWDRFFNYTAQVLGGTITPQGTIQEDDMPSANEVALAILDFEVNQVGPGQAGKITLGSLLAEYRTNNNAIVENTSAWIMPEVVALRELVKQLSVKQGVTIDYDAIAKAVNDDDAKRMVK